MFAWLYARAVTSRGNMSRQLYSFSQPPNRTFGSFRICCSPSAGVFNNDLSHDSRFNSSLAPGTCCGARGTATLPCPTFEDDIDDIHPIFTSMLYRLKRFEVVTYNSLGPRNP